MEPTSGQTIGAKALLRNVAAEVACWAQVAERLDDLVGQLSASTDDSVNRLGVDLQDMDALRQALHALAQITSSAADEFPMDADVLLSHDALTKSVTMESVRNACLRTERAAQTEVDDQQDMYLF
ncbi:hypothetical protein [Jannaschia sp. CCS1]|uniref:hypothetical protein n=1 Tax=Jannaschia sp. (strain CCS1) TaxID=290400 RepID=UPI000053C676|nr:hypothetical protein [Jannaschia sp. CCS1]ABD55754.1 hypothetical protein Jann_2837 [Jannaschia sp. CCS1]